MAYCSLNLFFEMRALALSSEVATHHAAGTFDRMISDRGRVDSFKVGCWLPSMRFTKMLVNLHAFCVCTSPSSHSWLRLVHALAHRCLYLGRAAPTGTATKQTNE